ncbi:MAG TPA: NAD(P)H-dependent oxidoreductase subunit E [Solirubrobacteraceae bacterium]
MSAPESTGEELLLAGTPWPVPRYQHGSRVPGWDESADLTKAPAGVPDPALTEVPADLRAEIEGHMANYPDRRSATLPALAAAQRVHGWCSPEAIEQVACVMRVTPGYLESVASFYDMLETTPVGRHSVYVCTNISCSLCGADQLLEAISAAVGEDPDFNVRAFECLGACDIAPMASVDGVYVGPLSTDDIPQLLEDTRAGRPVLPEKQLARRLVADPHANSQEFAEHPAQPGTAGQRSSAAPTGSSPGANPDIDPDRASFGEPMTGDRPGPSAAHEQSHTQPPHEGEVPHQARSDQEIPHHPYEPPHPDADSQDQGEAAESSDGEAQR